jgi:hypothetical protein
MTAACMTLSTLLFPVRIIDRMLTIQGAAHFCFRSLQIIGESSIPTDLTLLYLYVWLHVCMRHYNEHNQSG